MGGKVTSNKDKAVIKSVNPKVKIISKNSIKQPVNKSSMNSLNSRNINKKVKLANDITEESLESKVLKLFKNSNENLEDLDLIEEALSNQFFMRSLDKKSRIEVIRKMSLYVAKPDVVLFKQGNLGTFYYIIKEGSVELLINDKPIKKISKGESFGELALLHEAPRSGTVKTLEETYVYCLERKSFRNIVNTINELNFEENKKFVDSISILANIDVDNKTILINNLIKEVYDTGTLIVKEGEIGNCLYIIKEGEVECESNGIVIRTLNKGDYFGQKSILSDIPRTMNVRAKKNSIIYSISVETLKSMVGEKYRDVLILNFIKSALQKSHTFEHLNPNLIEDIYEKFTVKNFQNGNLVLKKGYQINSKIIIIIEGNVVNSKTKDILGQRGQILFEKDIVCSSKEHLKEDFIANPDCLLVECEIEVFVKILGGSLQKILERSLLLESLKLVPIFKNFTELKLNNLVGMVKIEKYNNGDKIIKQGEITNKFYIIKSGKVDIMVKNQYVRTLNTDEYFGEKGLFFNEPRSATVIANGAVETYTLNKTDFESIIEPSMKSFLISRFHLTDNVELTDLDYYKELGSGNYGSVSLVKSRVNNSFYAIKIINRQKIDYEELHNYLTLERSILLQIDHPFIVKLVRCLRDKAYVYFLMEYIKGKELFEVIRDIGLLNKIQTIYYGASMMIAINYLHKRQFIYRDIKPENIIVTENGFIKMIDFGTAKKISDRTSTVIGTPHYMAPEVILGEGYSFSVDYWSIAICIYEFMCGNVPFGDSADDPMEVYMAIVHDHLSFPKYINDKEFTTLMKQMLHKNPVNRLFRFDLIKQNVWFNNFEWDKLSNLSIEPPYFPKIKKEELIDRGSFTEYMTKLAAYVPPKDKKIEKTKQSEYDKWHQSF